MFSTYFSHLNGHHFWGEENFENCLELTCYFTSEYLLQGTILVFFPSVTSNLKLKTHGQLTQSPFTGTDCLLDTCYWEFHSMLTNFCLKDLCCHSVRFEIGSYRLCSAFCYFYKYVCDTYICTFTCCCLYVCNAGCICMRHQCCLKPDLERIRHYVDDTFRLGLTFCWGWMLQCR